MRGDFVNSISEALKIRRKELLEKDLILHQILLGLSEDRFFMENFLFKGGTCLIKCYLGYFRFSEDMDFTWKDQKAFAGVSQKEIRRRLSGTTNSLGSLLERIAERRRLDFRCEKDNRRYVEIGGGNKTLTLKVWYLSEFLKRESFVKIQINFLEKLLFPAARTSAASLLAGRDLKEARLLFPDEYSEYSRSITLESYDIREIFCEKVRAILTRRGVKARDFVDCYLISRRFGLKPESLQKEISEKILFMMGLYEKYRDNIREKPKLLRLGIFTWGVERNLLLSEIDEINFHAFLPGFSEFLRKTAENCAGSQK